MENAKHELKLFLAGVLMLTVGLFYFSQKVMVYSSFFGGWSWGGLHITSGAIMIPFIAGIIWMFTSGASFGSKVLTILGVVLVLASVILSTSIRLETITLYEWVIMLVLIFGGAGFIVRVLLGGKSDEEEYGYKGRKKSRKEGKMDEAVSSELAKAKKLEDELNEMKKRNL